MTADNFSLVVGALGLAVGIVGAAVTIHTLRRGSRVRIAYYIIDVNTLSPTFPGLSLSFAGSDIESAASSVIGIRNVGHHPIPYQDIRQGLTIRWTGAQPRHAAVSFCSDERVRPISRRRDDHVELSLDVLEVDDVFETTVHWAPMGVDDILVEGHVLGAYRGLERWQVVDQVGTAAIPLMLSFAGIGMTAAGLSSVLLAGSSLTFALLGMGFGTTWAAVALGNRVLSVRSSKFRLTRIMRRPGPRKAAKKTSADPPASAS